MTTDTIDFNKELADAQEQTAKLVAIATENGFVLDTRKWLTIKRYAEKYNLSTQVVTNWITRGTIPADNTMTVPELNDMRLVLDQPYK